MILVVSDTGPVNYLVLIGQIDLLPKLADRIVLPAAVHRELLNSQAPDAVRQWASVLPGWIEVQAASQSLSAKGLSSANCEAIALARELSATLLLMDDRLARRFAASVGVATMGTLGLLEVAARRDLISLAEAVQKLRSTSCFLAEELIEDALRRDRERRK